MPIPPRELKNGVITGSRTQMSCATNARTNRYPIITIKLAEGRGFEPLELLHPLAFEASAISHSANPRGGESEFRPRAAFTPLAFQASPFANSGISPNWSTKQFALHPSGFPSVLRPYMLTSAILAPQKFCLTT